jgi:GDPmannose 4,6-dehydratase
MTNRALVTGINGQDGSYLAELLLEKGYEVYGIVRRSSSINTTRIDHLLLPTEKIKLVYGDLTGNIETVLHDINPDIIFNMASMSHVRVSFDVPIYTMDTNAVGPTRILEAIRNLGWKNKVRIYHASSSEQFGMSPPPQNENTQFVPCSPYGIAKLAAYWMVRTYRDGYGLFASNGILFNHCGPRRGETFVEKKIVRAAVRIKLGKQKDITLGNLEAKRDWGSSKEYMEAVYKIIMHSVPDDFVVATGECYSVKEFLEKVFAYLGLDWKKYVRIEDRYKRPKEVPELLGNPEKIKRVLGWEPKTKIQDLIDEMVRSVMLEEQNS